MGRLTPRSLARLAGALGPTGDDVFYDVGAGDGGALCAVRVLAPHTRLAGVEVDGALVDACRANLARFGAVAALRHADVGDLRDLGDATLVYCFAQGMRSAAAMLRACAASRCVRAVALVHDARQRSHPVVRYGERARAEGRATTFQAVMAGGLERYTCWVVRTRRAL
jgi:precorrin-6B methylase 2